MEEFEKNSTTLKKSSQASPLQTFYDIPNHFPLLTKGGISQWLPRQYKQLPGKNFQLPLYTPTSSMLQSTNHSFDSPNRKLTLTKISIQETQSCFSSKVQKEKLQNKAKMISLCDDLEISVRKIPSFQIKGIPTPTHNRYEMMKTVSPLKVTVDFTEKPKIRKIVEKKRKFNVSAPEMDEKKKVKNKEWIFLYFLEAIRASNGISLSFHDGKNFKFFVGPGNNSGLIVRVLRSRPWWVQTDKRKEANLIWTSLKHSKTLKKLPSGKNVQIEIVRNFSLPRKKQQDSQMFGFHLVLDSIFFQKIESSGFSSVKLCNKLEENEQIASKKLLFSNMKSLYSRLNKNLFEVIPVTFHVKSTNDPEFSDFEAFFNSNPNSIWIVKPGENTNRGKGISLAASVSEVKALVSDKSSSHTCIIQKYIERPLLINKRKFDIRCFALMTSVNSVIQGYFYTEGYIRTSSKEFSLKNLENKFIHLTNDAIQKHSEDYGKFEPSNKMSYADLQNYITQTYPKHGINFEKDLLSKIKEIVSDSFSSVSQKIDPHRRLNCFELFGFDFMIDEDFHVWLIEANTNPCLETSCAFLSRVIPACIDNTFRIVADPLFPSFDNRKGCSWIEEGNIGNKFELVYNELIGTR